MYSTLYLVRHGQTVFNTRLLIQGRCDSPLTELGRDQARAAAEWLGARGVRIDAAFSSPAERACGTMELLWAGPYQRLVGLRERSFGELEGTDVLALPKPMGDYPAKFGGEPERDLEDRLSATMASIMRGNFGSPGGGSTSVLAAPEPEVPTAAAERFASGPGSLRGNPEPLEPTSGCPAPGVPAPCPPARPIPGRTDAPIEACAIEPLPASAPPSGNVLVVSHGAACKAFARAWEHHAEVGLPSPFPNCCVLVYRFDGESFRLVEVADPAAHLGGEGLPI